MLVCHTEGWQRSVQKRHMELLRPLWGSASGGRGPGCSEPGHLGKGFGKAQLRSCGGCDGMEECLPAMHKSVSRGIRSSGIKCVFYR